jgi:hypothetical protein
MARDLSSDFLTHMVASKNIPIALVEMEFASTTVRIWSGYGDLSWSGYTWLGNGWFQRIEGAEETDQVEAIDLAVVISGVPSTIRSLVLGDQKQNASGKVYIGFLDSAGAVTATYLWWKGKYSHTELEVAGDGLQASLIYEAHLVAHQRPKELRMNKATQEIYFAGDLGFDYEKAAANFDGHWGGQKKKPEKKRPKPPKNKK